MRYSKLFVNSVLLFTIPSLAVYPQADIPATTVYVEETAKAPLEIDSLPSYDDILRLIDDLETGELEKRCSPADLEKINHFLANLAIQGILPNELEEEVILENDIQELLNGDGNPYEYSLSFDQIGNYVLVPNVYGRGELYPCKGWFSKTWHRTKKFVKNHKKAIIIGAAVVVAAVVVGIAAAALTTATAGAAASGSDNDKSKSKGDEPSAPSISSSDPISALTAATESPIVNSAIEQISSLKENFAKEFFQPTPGESSLGESGRILGSLFAHDSFKNLTGQFSDQSRLSEELQNLSWQSHLPTTTSLDFGHQEIDRKFSTDYASLYTNPNFDGDFNALSFQLRGENALHSGNFNQAIHDFGKAIELGPTNPLPYLERSVAHFGLGEYDRSLEDYHHYTSQAEIPHPLANSDLKAEFAFATGLNKGICESGLSLLSFISDAITQPVHTAKQTYDAFALLSNLARTEQWEVLGEILAPEVHQLVREWDSLPPEERGKLAGFAFGKLGADIILPVNIVKAASKGLKGAQQLNTIYKGLQTAEKTLLLESVAGLENGTKIAEVIQTSQKTIALGEELGFSSREMVQLKQSGQLEGAIANSVEHIATNPALRESYEIFENAQAILKSYAKKTMPETQARELIHQTGIRTFPKPDGIPEDFLVMISDKGSGMIYAKNTHTYVRVMPGKPHSPFSHQQKPYVNQRVHGKSLDKHGKIVPNDSPEAHIPLEEYIYRGIE